MTKIFGANISQTKGENSAELHFEPNEFIDFLENNGWSDEEKSQYVALIWRIVCEFVSLGFNIHPIQIASESQSYQPDDLAEPTESNDETIGPPPNL